MIVAAGPCLPKPTQAGIKTSLRHHLLTAPPARPKVSVLLCQFAGRGDGAVECSGDTLDFERGDHGACETMGRWRAP